MLSIGQKTLKRTFDIFVSILILVPLFLPIILVWLIASIDTKSNGLFFQKRVGYKGKFFNVIKIKTMKSSDTVTTTVTTKNDARITKIGAFWRNYKIDELPQLFNVLFGSMSIVGPRPDVPGFADKLEGHERKVLDIKPGITGPASLKYKNEEAILAAQEHPEKYNIEVIFPDKVKINMEYIENYSFENDMKIIFKTLGL